MDYICKICGQKIESNGHFWSQHSQKISDYFHQYEPRVTKTGQKVLFKNSIEKFFDTDFNDLNERRDWAKKNPELAREYFIDLLVRRKIKKNWIYAPGETLLILSSLPKICYFEKEFNLSFSELCKKLGFKIRYKNKFKEVNWADSLKIIQDTREQKNLIFPNHIESVVTKLNYGDYAAENNVKIAIERKSISDFAGTLSAGFDRFKREIERAKKDKGYLVILVEASFNDFKSIEFLPQTKHIKSSYDHLAKRSRELHEEFDNFQLCFADGRKHASKIVEFVLKQGKKIKNIDIQFLIDSKKL